MNRIQIARAKGIQAVNILPGIALLFLVFNFIGINDVYSQIKLLNAHRISDAPKIDGSLSDGSWREAMGGTDFVEFSPDPNTPSSQRTVVKVLYDDKAVYVSAKMYDSNGNIRRELGLRDDDNVNADRFEVFIDPFMSGQNAYKFGVTSSGVQLDSRITPDGEEISWDEVWTVDTHIEIDGWVAEFKIPYSAFRFPERDFQTWGLNFKRVIRSTREESYWNTVLPDVDGFANQFGILQGMGRIEPPLRFSLTPFLVSNFLRVYKENRDDQAWDTKFSGGIDLKLGLNESYTLDMTLIPDFGQVEFDDVVLNLTPFEQRFDENRPFFTEGTDLFDRFGEDLFYSRRIGGKPILHDDIAADAALTDNDREILNDQEILTFNPIRANLWNAIKFTGRNRRGLGIGIFNGISGPTDAEIIVGQDGEIIRNYLINPLTNYNAVVIDQLFLNNSYISFINTNVTRKKFADDENYKRANQRFGDANVTGVKFRYATKANDYAIFGNGIISQKFLVDDDSDPIGNSGFTYGLGFGKIGGKFRWEVSRETMNDTYDTNDLGILLRNNLNTNKATVEYRIFKPFGAFNNVNSFFTLTNEQLYRPQSFITLQGEAGVNTTLKNFISLGLGALYSPWNSYDFFEPRVDGYKFRIPKNFTVNGFVSTDYRKALAIDFDGEYKVVPEWNLVQFAASAAPRIRVTNWFTVIPKVEYLSIKNDHGFVDLDGNGLPIFGIRDRKDLTYSATANLLFNKDMSISVRGRLYNAEVDYTKDLVKLKKDGTFGSPINIGDQDRGFQTFNIDMVYRYRFAPGSEINLIWKQGSIDSSIGGGPITQNPPTNLFSIKVLYFLNYLTLRKSRPVDQLEGFE